VKREVEEALVRRAFANLDAKHSDSEGEPFELQVSLFLDADVLAKERALLRATPVCVGFASQVARPGDFLTQDHAGVPIVVTRAEDGVLRAFVNACRHRGTRIADGCGSAQRLTCPYHGWAYGLDGKLGGVPHRSEFAGVDLATRGLVELPVWTRFGLVFARLAPGAADAPAWGFADDLDGFGLAQHVLHAPSVRERRMNWKLMMDGSWESYHFRVAHAKTIASLFLDNTGVFDFADGDVRMMLIKRTLLDLDRAAPDTWRIRPHANLLYGLFPNTIVLVQSDHAMVVTVWPVAVDRTVIAGGMLVPEAPATEKALAYWKRNEDIFWTAIEEDIDMGERIQSTLASGANPTLLFGRNEHLIGKYHRVLDARMR
jgi:phenylpropionate dioxygenase-like ring-hydroxylating dioxygenase large terminal subunit